MAKKAVLVGCNYPGTDSKLGGCVNDVIHMYSILVDKFGFDPENVVFMTDETIITERPLRIAHPTGAAIRSALESMVVDAQTGDTFFFHFSGHGGRNELDSEGEIDDTGFDECIYPTDHDIIDDDYFRDLLNTLPGGVTFTVVSDSCHSGGLIDQAKEQIGNSFEKLPTEQEQQGEEETVDAEDNGGERALVKSRELPPAVAAKILRERYGRDDIDARNVGAKIREIFGRSKKGSSKSTTKASKGSKKAEKKSKKNKNKKKTKKEDSSSDSDSDHERGYDVEGYGVEVYGEDEEEEEARNIEKRRSVGVLVSGCQSHQTSADVQSANPPYGALTHAITTVLEMLEPAENISNRQLVLRLRRHLAAQSFSQEPGLYCADDKVDQPFICPLA